MAKKPTENSAAEKSAETKKTAAKKTTAKKAAPKKEAAKEAAAEVKKEKKATTKTTPKKTTTEKAKSKKATPKKVTAKAEEPVVDTEVADTTVDVAVKEDEKSNSKTVNSDHEEFLSNFNWHNYQEGIDVIEDKQLEEFEKLVKENFVDTADDDVIEGEVVYMTDREAIIDINAKSEGVISLNEFRYNPDLKV